MIIPPSEIKNDPIPVRNDTVPKKKTKTDKKDVQLMSNINFDELIRKIESIFSKGQGVKMKNKDQFQITLTSTKNTIVQNKSLFNSLRREPNMIKIFDELNYTVQDLESKLNKLALISFCRDRAEKYLANVTQKLENINMILLSFLAGTKTKGTTTVISDNSELMEQINLLNAKINSMEMNNKEPTDKVVTFTTNKEKLYEGIKHLDGINTRVNYKLAYELFTQVASNDKNNIEAKLLLAKMYENGYYVDKSFTKAFDLYHEAYEKGNPTAMYKLGFYAENNFYDISHNKLQSEYSTDYEKTAMTFYTKAADKNYSDALARLGFIYENGLLGNEINKKVATDYYKKSVEIDENPVGLNGMGNYYYGLQNYTLALENYKKASKLGNVEALINLGICFEYGHGVERNLIKAMDCYKEAGEHNNPIALCNQAILLIKMDISQGTHVNFSESFKLLQLSTHLDRHNKDAYYYLGFLFEIGYDVFGDGNTIQNAMMAFFYYKKAAELGHIKAKMKVGVAIYNGIENVFVHDEIKGIELIKEASNEGDKEASEYLKMLMDNGKMIY